MIMSRGITVDAHIEHMMNANQRQVAAALRNEENDVAEQSRRYRVYDQRNVRCSISAPELRSADHSNE